MKSKRKVKELENKYNIKRKELTLVIEKLKQRMSAESAKIKRYEQRIFRMVFGVWKRNTT